MPGSDFATQVVGDELHPVADAEHRNAGAQGFWVDLWRTGFVDARRAPAQDQADWLALLQLRPWRCPGHQLAVDVRLAHATRDQLAELGPEVENEHRLLPDPALELFAVRGGRGSPAQLSSSPYPLAGPPVRPR